MRPSSLLAAALLLVGCPDPAKDKTKAVVAPAAPAAVPQELAPLAGAVRYGFSQADSKVAFTGAKVTGKHPGGFNTFSGVVELVEKDLTKSRVQVSLELASVFTDSEKLTGHLKNADFFDVERFPRARFVSTALRPVEGTRAEVTGELTLHGVTRSITFPADITVADDGVAVAAEFALNRKDFGIVYPGKPDDLIADHVLLALSVRAKKE